MRAVMGILLVASLITIAGAQQAVDVTRIGPQVGQQVPAFTLNDQHGRQLTVPVTPAARHREGPAGDHRHARLSGV